MYRNVKADNLQPLLKDEGAEYNLHTKSDKRDQSKENLRNKSHSQTRTAKSGSNSEKSFDSLEMDEFYQPYPGGVSGTNHCQPISCLKPPLGTMVKLKPGVTMKKEEKEEKDPSKRKKNRSRSRKKRTAQKRNDEYSSNFLAPGKSSHVVTSSGRNSSVRSSRSDVSSFQRPASRFTNFTLKEPNDDKEEEDDEEEDFEPLKDRIFVNTDAVNKTLYNADEKKSRIRIHLKKNNSSLYSTKLRRNRNNYSRSDNYAGNYSQDVKRDTDRDIGLKTENKFFHKRNISRGSNYRQASRERNSVHSFTRSLNQSRDEPNVKVFQKNTSLGLARQNASAESLKASLSKFDTFNHSVLQNDHDLSHQKGSQESIKMAFRPIRDTNIKNSYHSITNSAYKSNTKIQSSSKHALLDDEYNESLGSPIIRGSYLNKLKPFSKLPREKLSNKLMKMKFKNIQKRQMQGF